VQRAGAGRSGRLTGFGIAQLVSTAWPIAILGCVSLGVGPAGPDRLWQKPGASNSFQLTRHEHEHRVVGQSDHEPSGTAHRVGMIIFASCPYPLASSMWSPWWIDVHPPGEAFVVTTAPTTPQVEAILWRYMGNAHRNASLPGRITLDAKWYTETSSSHTAASLLTTTRLLSKASTRSIYW
jgi:hypothetical protein